MESNQLDLTKVREWLEDKKYNEEPVYYCKQCLSLHIMILDENTDYCGLCSNTDIAKAHIDEWDILYKEKYGKSLMEE